MSGANDMSSTLGEVFGTIKTASPSAEDLEKRAQVEFFNGLCKEHGINIKALNDKQVDDLWKVAMDMRKEAGEMPPQFAKKDGDDKGGDKKPEAKDDKADKEKEAAAAKVAAAEAEFTAVKTAATKVAEAEAMGRIMAHSFVNELDKIAEKREGGFPFPPKKDGDGKGDKEKDGKEKEASSADKAAALVAAFQSKTAGTAPAAEGASNTQNFDELAAYRAIDLLKEAGVDADEAFSKVSAAYILGLKESTKLASAPNAAAGLEMRALEICEAAGYAVNWPG